MTYGDTLEICGLGARMGLKGFLTGVPPEIEKNRREKAKTMINNTKNNKSLSHWQNNRIKIIT